MSVGGWRSVSTLSSQRRPQPVKSQPGIHSALAKPHHWQLQELEAVPGTRGKHPTHFGWECLSLNNAFQYFFVDAKTQSFHCFWQGPSCPGWCWRGTSLTVITCKCIYLLKLMIATVFRQGWSQRLWVKAFMWDSLRTINFTSLLSVYSLIRLEKGNNPGDLVHYNELF